VKITSWRYWVAGGLFALLGSVRPAPAQGPAPSIRGRVVVDVTPLTGATVIAVNVTTKRTFSARTDDAGQFILTVGESGTYTVRVTAIGYYPQERTVSASTRQSSVELAFNMVTAAARLPAVKSVGERARTPRSDMGADGSIGGTVAAIDLTNPVFGNVDGDVSSASAVLSTVSIDRDGRADRFSIFGIDPEQNGVTLNGLSFQGQIPRDGFRVVNVQATYDPTRGGFAGFQQSLHMLAGSNTRTMTTRVSRESALAASGNGSPFKPPSDVSVVSGRAVGPVVTDRIFYAVAYQGSKRQPLSLPKARSDSNARIIAVLPTIGLAVPGATRNFGRPTSELRIAARVDVTPDLPNTFANMAVINSAHYDAYYAEIGGTARRSAGLASTSGSLGSERLDISFDDAWAQLTAAKFLPDNVLNELTVGVAAQGNRSIPASMLPAINVAADLATADERSRLGQINVIGDDSPEKHQRARSFALRDQLSWNSRDRRHTFTAGLELDVRSDLMQSTPGPGTYFYSSVTDFEQQKPLTFARTLGETNARALTRSGAISFGDVFVVGRGLRRANGVPAPTPTIQYGLRFERFALGGQPRPNVTVDSLFGVNVFRLPSGQALLPMIGFRWPLLGPVRLDNGAAIGRRLILTGGFRRYRGSITTQVVQRALSETGAPGSPTQLFCVGDAVPELDWTALVSGIVSPPTDCRPEAMSIAAAQSAPSVTRFSRNFLPYESQRSAVGATYFFRPELRVDVEATVARNVHLPSVVDLNLDHAPKFVLSDEARRPIYASASDVAAARGLVLTTGSRRFSEINHLSEMRSDLRASAKTLTASFAYRGFSTPGQPVTTAAAAFTWNVANEQVRGFDAAGSGDLNHIVWSRSQVPDGVLVASAAHTRPGLGSISVWTRMQSGAPFSPLVGADINADGYSNDLAFVFDPAATRDSVLAAAMHHLLVAAARNARECLEAQLGQIARRNSCDGVWSAPMINVALSPDSYRLRLGNRGGIDLVLTNVFGALDRLLHGPSRLRGWGQFASADPVLLNVSGFDSQRNSFKYRVNDRFGRTLLLGPGYGVTVNLRLELGPDRETQYIRAATRPQGTRAPTAEILRERIAQHASPTDLILFARDSLKLRSTQVDSLAKIARRFATQRDTIVSALAEYLSQKDDRALLGSDVRERWHSAAVAAYNLLFAETRCSLDVLDSTQRLLVRHHPQVSHLLDLAAMTPSTMKLVLRGPLTGLP
jgi:hypothetical protein